MTAATPEIDLIESFHGTPDGAFGITLIGGHIEQLTLPMSAMDPTTAEELGTTLVALLNEALDKHTTDILEAAAPQRTPLDAAFAAIEDHAAEALSRARATIDASPILRRNVEAAVARSAAPSVTGTSRDNDVKATLSLGRLQSLVISEHLLHTTRPAEAATAIVAAVHDALHHATIDQHHLIDALNPHQLAEETNDLHHRIIMLDAELT